MKGHEWVSKSDMTGLRYWECYLCGCWLYQIKEYEKNTPPCGLKLHGLICEEYQIEIVHGT